MPNVTSGTKSRDLLKPVWFELGFELKYKEFLGIEGILKAAN